MRLKSGAGARSSYDRRVIAPISRFPVDLDVDGLQLSDRGERVRQLTQALS
jgi:hypothetical protein